MDLAADDEVVADDLDDHLDDEVVADDSVDPTDDEVVADDELDDEILADEEEPRPEPLSPISGILVLGGMVLAMAGPAFDGGAGGPLPPSTVATDMAMVPQAGTGPESIHLPGLPAGADGQIETPTIGTTPATAASATKGATPATGAAATKGTAPTKANADSPGTQPVRTGPAAAGDNDLHAAWSEFATTSGSLSADDWKARADELVAKTVAAGFHGWTAEIRTVNPISPSLHPTFKTLFPQAHSPVLQAAFHLPTAEAGLSLSTVVEDKAVAAVLAAKPAQVKITAERLTASVDPQTRQISFKGVVTAAE